MGFCTQLHYLKRKDYCKRKNFIICNFKQHQRDSQGGEGVKYLTFGLFLFAQGATSLNIFARINELIN
jgi:hypothetical protein